MGILASSGVFGPQFVPAGRSSPSSAITIPPYNPDITLPAPFLRYCRIDRYLRIANCGAARRVGACVRPPGDDAVLAESGDSRSATTPIRYRAERHTASISTVPST